MGRIGGAEESIIVDASEVLYTDPLDAVKFVQEAEVDSLAVAAGTAHGQYKGEPLIDFERIIAIKNLVNLPLVLHGCS